MCTAGCRVADQRGTTDVGTKVNSSTYTTLTGIKVRSIVSVVARSRVGFGGTDARPQGTLVWLVALVNGLRRIAGCTDLYRLKNTGALAAHPLQTGIGVIAIARAAIRTQGAGGTFAVGANTHAGSIALTERDWALHIRARIHYNTLALQTKAKQISRAIRAGGEAGTGGVRTHAQQAT